MNIVDYHLIYMCTKNLGQRNPHPVHFSKEKYHLHTNKNLVGDSALLSLLSLSLSPLFIALIVTGIS